MAIPPIARKVFSLLGVVPLGIFLVEHLYVMGSILRGDRAFLAAMRALGGIPYVRVVEIVFLVVPLALHALFGIYLIAARKPLVEPSPYSTRVTVLVRLTGLVALVFIAYHFYEFRVRFAETEPEPLLSLLAARLSATSSGIPFFALFYLLGVTATVFHFAAGVWGAGVSFRVLRSDRARGAGAWAMAAVGVVFSLVGANAVVCLATGSRYFAPGDYSPIELDTSPTACPAPSQ